MKSDFYVFFAVTLLLLLASCGEEGDIEDPEAGRVLDFMAEVIFHTPEGDSVAVIRAAVADDDASRSTGLMDVTDLPEEKGMIFVFDDERARSFWMANTPLALDIIFADAEGRIIRIHQNTRPYSDRNILSEGPAQYVVEVNAGYTLRHDIREGMYISTHYEN